MSEATVVCSGRMSLPDRENLPLPKPPLRSFRMAALRSKTKRCLFETRSTATEADSFPSIFCVNVFSVVCGTTGGRQGDARTGAHPGGTEEAHRQRPCRGWIAHRRGAGGGAGRDSAQPDRTAHQACAGGRPARSRSRVTVRLRAAELMSDQPVRSRLSQEASRWISIPHFCRDFSLPG
jgi:hypothetical protein